MIDYDIFSEKNNKRYLVYLKKEENKNKFTDLGINYEDVDENKCLLINYLNNEDYLLEDNYKVYDKLFYLKYENYLEKLKIYQEEAIKKINNLMIDIENKCSIIVTLNYNLKNYKIKLPTTISNLTDNILNRALFSENFFNFTSIDGLLIFNNVPVNFAKTLLNAIADFKNKRSANYYSLAFTKIRNALTFNEIDNVVTEFYDIELNGNDKGWGVINNEITFTLTDIIENVYITKWININNEYVLVDVTEQVLEKIKIN